VTPTLQLRRDRPHSRPSRPRSGLAQPPRRRALLAQLRLNAPLADLRNPAPTSSPRRTAPEAATTLAQGRRPARSRIGREDDVHTSPLHRAARRRTARPPGHLPAARNRRARPQPPRSPTAPSSRVAWSAPARRERSAPPPPSLGCARLRRRPLRQRRCGEGWSGRLETAAARVSPVSPEEGDAGVGLHVWNSNKTSHACMRVTFSYFLVPGEKRLPR
jgi:hypothetical protein